MNRTRFWLRLSAILLPIFTLILGYQWFFNPNFQFQRLQTEFSKAYQATLPADSLPFNILLTQTLQTRQAIFNKYDAEFRSIPVEKLKPAYQKQWRQSYDLIQLQMAYLQKMQNDPSFYNAGIHLQKILQLKEISLSNRLIQINKYLQFTPKYYTIAKENLVQPDSNLIAPAIHSNRQLLYFLQNALTDSLRKAHLPDTQRQNILHRIHSAQIAVKDYLAFCRSIQFEHQDANYSK